MRNMSFHESYQKWIQVGRELGLSDTALNDFVKSEIAQERETRSLDRQMMKLQAEEQQAEKQREREIELAKIQDAEKQREKDYEIKVMQIQMEKEIAIKRLEYESDKVQREAQMRQTEIETRSRFLSERNETENSHFRNFNLGLPKFNNDSAQLPAFLSRFETLARAYNLPSGLWSLELSKSLEGIALQVFESLSAENRLDYDALKCALLKRFEITEGTFRKLFLTSKTAPMESQSDFAQRLTGYLRSWLKHAGYDQTYDDLETLMVKSCYFKSQPKPIQIFIKEKGQKLTLEQMITFSESYRDAHGIIPGEIESGNKFLSGKNEKIFTQKATKGNVASVTKNVDRVDKSTPTQTKIVEGEKDKRRCYGCQSDKHMLKDCPHRNERGSSKNFPNQKNAACYVVTPTDQGNKLLGNCQGRTVSLLNGDFIPFVAAVKQQEKYLPDLTKPHKGIGYVDGQKVKFVRDTASSITIVRADLVKPEQITDKEVTVMLADGCIKTYPLAEISISTPYYAGKILAACIKTAIHQLLVGNDYLNQEIIEKEQADGITEYKGPIIFENSNCEKRDECYDYKTVVRNANVNLVQNEKPSRHEKLPNDGRSIADDLVDVMGKQSETIPSNRCSDDRNRLVTEDDMTKRPGQCETENRSMVKPIKGELILPENVVRYFHKKECGLSTDTGDENCKSLIDKVEMGDGAYESNPCATDQRGSDVIASDFVVRNSAAVQTRSQQERENKAIRPLKLSKFEALNLSVEQFRQLQKEDQNLVKYWQMAKNTEDDQNDKIRFVIENEILYREYKIGSNGDAIRQLMIPEPLIDKVICYAHESLLSGHSSLTRTIDNLTQEFYFYSMHSRVKRWVQSCDLCQRGGNRKVGGRAPIMSMPIVKDPFDTVYIDIVGEIQPCSTENHRWILTLMCASTRFPIFKAMKKIDSVSIAEALMEEFNTFGHPRVIISDNGANVSSEILKEANRLYGTRMHQIPVYRPEANSVLERAHQTMKGILRKLVVEQPKMWHRFLSPLLFAIRSTKNVSGFSPFELLFGRSCRTHLTLLKELWTKNDNEPETKTVYQYVLDLRERIENTCELAQKELSKVQQRNQRYVNAKAKLRILQPGMKVLVLIPDPKRKLDFIWRGPAEVIGRRGVVNYRIKFDDGQERTYHINMLKQYFCRDDLSGHNHNKSMCDNLSLSEEGQKDETNIYDGNKLEECATMGLVEESDDEEKGDDANENAIRTDSGKMELYNITQKETWSEVDINPELTEQQRNRLWKIVEQYGDIFSDVPTTTNLIKHRIELTTDVPVTSKPYKIPIHMQDAVDKEINCLLQNGWIEKSTAEYASPIVVVKKKNTTDIRLCVNYKKLNDITKEFPQPMPEIEDIISKVGRAKVFTTVDMCKGYYAVAMDEKSKDYTTFCTPRELYRFNVMPFGLKNSGSTYGHLLKQYVLKDAENMQNFVDDVIVYNETMNQHEKSLRDLFQRIRDANLKVKPSKTKIGYSEISFLGHVISHGEVKPSQENVKKILEAPIPKTKSGIRSLCGTIGFLRKFIPDSAALLKPLHALTGKNCSNVIQWGEEQQRALEQIRLALTSQPVLKVYDPVKKHVLQTDASNEYISGVLLEEDDDGMLHPVIYASRRLLDREMRYHIAEKEMLAIVWSCNRLYKYLYGSHFTIQTDCQALCILNGKMSNNARILRWQLYMQSFNFTVEVIKGSDNCLADYLTRVEL
jgi:hypothetical protein